MIQTSEIQRRQRHTQYTGESSDIRKHHILCLAYLIYSVGIIVVLTKGGSTGLIRRSQLADHRFQPMLLYGSTGFHNVRTPVILLQRCHECGFCPMYIHDTQFKAQPNMDGALTHSLMSVLIAAELYWSTIDLTTMMIAAIHVTLGRIL